MGVLEILIVLAIALVVFGGFFRKQLPQLGRKAGTNARIGAEKARELADASTAKVNETVGDKIDPAAIGRSAGKGVREARELRDSFNAPLDAPGEPTEASRGAEDTPDTETRQTDERL